MYRDFGKRLLDLLIAGFVLMILSPLLLTLWLLVRWRLGSPALFVQERPGLNGTTFRLIKFRSMTDARDKAGKQLPDSVRLTKFGGFLRASSLDELPELWNVLKGEMSLVGPRPLLMEYLPFYTAEESTRHSVRPGITGLAQTSGRNSLGWNARLAIDVRYVKEMSLGLDLKILFQTLAKVLRREGVVVVPSTQARKLSIERATR